MDCCRFFLWACLAWGSFTLGASQLQSSQAQVLLQLKKYLENPKQLDIWVDRGTNFCYLPQSEQVNMTCESGSVTELNIFGDRPSDKAGDFQGFAAPNLTLSHGFSMDSFVTTLSRLSDLRVLRLVSVGIWGSLPDKISRLPSLEYLDLSSNFLFGSIPPKMSQMVHLQTLKLDDNFFNGTMTGWFDSMSNLTLLSLKNNKLSGELPGIRSPSKLQKIDLSSNQLSGSIPPLLFSLKTLVYLDLASNDLYGSLPNDLHCGSKLEFVDISYNKLTGELPTCLRNKASGPRVVKYDRNCLTTHKGHQRPNSYCIEAVEAETHSGAKKSRVMVASIVGILALVLVLGLLFLCIRCCRRSLSEQHLLHKNSRENSVTGFSSEIITGASFISESTKLGSPGLPACRPFTLEEIKKATNNFDSSMKMGEGSYGMLYRGKLENGTEVAIRCLPSSKKYSVRNLKLRLDLLAKLRHPHLVCLLGHCIDGGGSEGYAVEKVFLIYEYVPNGNFHDLLSEESSKKALSWSERLAILIGVAKAVHFLHTGVIPGFFSNRLKTNNILLNGNQFAKLSDYGLSIVSEAARYNRAQGESPKSWETATLEDDVYSFGFILLEAIIGPSGSSRKETFLREELASLDSKEERRRMVEHAVLRTCCEESLARVISLMSKCILPDSLSRPTFEDILWNLQYSAQLQANAEGESRFHNVALQ